MTRASLFSWPLLIIQIICLMFLSLKVSSQCLRDQKSLLLQLKNNLIFKTAASESNSVQWNPSTDCCTWDGVTCNEGRVVGLHLSNKAITGGLTHNSSLFNLQYLESLDLSFNDFGVPIPSNFGKLTSLRYLNLSNSGFVGQIPIGISHMKNLVVLDLSVQSLIEVPLLKLENPNWSMLIRSLTKLEELYLDGVNMSATGKGWCRAFSSSPSNLRVLSLSDCSLSGPIDPSLRKLQFLSVLHLDNNNLSTPVPGFIANFSKLISLRLTSCGLYGKFPEEIFQVPTLQAIDLSYNILLQGSLPEFSQNNALHTIALESTSFSGRLPASINNLNELSRLHLHYCQFNGTLPNFMLPKLDSLDLSTNNFTGPIPSFKMSKNLKEILLSHNGLTGEIPLAHWEGLLKLLVVDLRNNSLSESIPSSIFAHSSLEVIQLSYNQFDGLLPEFPNASYSILRVLDLSSNNLEGPIPISIFGLQKLSVLSLSSNKLNGTIMLGRIQRLGNLTTLDLSYNNLSIQTSGDHSSWSSFSKISTLTLASCNLTVFPNLKNQSKLVYLDLSDNQIYGDVPNWIWDIGNGYLFHLNLSHNYLVGIQGPYTLPSSLATLDLNFNHIHGKIPFLPPFVGYVDLSNNFFTSSIPAEIGNNDTLFYLVFFSLASNGLTGLIPISICYSANLQVLDFSDNKLYGRIPVCMSEIMSQTLGVLNLQRNNFSGPIHDAFPGNCGLKTLSLNGNYIQGSLPKSLANCSALEVLDLGNNKMIGNFPCFLKNIATLRILVLRSNKFYGSIECANTNGAWRMVQIIDVACNHFSGELPIHWLTKSLVMTDDEAKAKSKLSHLRFDFLKLSSSLYYKDSVTVTSKGINMQLVKILTIFTSIDFSSNNFQGSIPEEVGQLQALYVLNLSNNALRGQIPSSLGNLRHLESLDLSLNSLSGTIPTSLGQLTFLSFLNLSFNHLVGRIPNGNQLQTFLANSFIGNDELCGLAWEKNCTGEVESSNENESSSVSTPEINWTLISALVGYIVGLGVVIWPLMFSKGWRRRYFEHVDDLGVRIFPRLYETTVKRNKRPKSHR